MGTSPKSRPSNRINAILLSVAKARIARPMWIFRRPSARDYDCTASFSKFSSTPNGAIEHVQKIGLPPVSIGRCHKFHAALAEKVTSALMQDSGAHLPLMSYR